MKVSARLAAIFALVTLCGFLAACGGGGSSATTAPSITTTSLPAGTMGVAYSATITATGGTAPYTFAVTSGTLPAGLALSASGVISGKPTTSGTSPFTVTVTDSEAAPKTATANLSIKINAATSTLAITTTTLPAGTVGTAYTATIVATGGTTPYTFAITTGTLPAGLSLNATTGAITGTPTTSGTSPFTVTVTDSSSPVQTATANLSITINATQKLVITTTTLPAGTVGTPYTATITATGGTIPYTFSITTGTLPAGLSLNATTGAITGTPTTSGTSPFTVTVTDSSSPVQTATANLSITISGGQLTITSPATLPGAIVNVPYSYTLAATGGTPPYTWTLQTGSTLPAGLSLSTAGVISGTPTTMVTGATFAIGVTDSGDPQESASQTFTLTVAPAAVLSGQYAFQISGLDSVSAPFPPAGYIGTFTADGNGNITGGAVDTNEDGVTTQNTITSGTYGAQPGGNTGVINVLYVGGGIDSFAYSISATSTNGSILLYNSGSNISFGVGTFQSVNSTDFSLPAIAGSYAFGLVSNDQGANPNQRSGTVGVFTMDSSGSLTDTDADYNDEGTFLASQALTGSFTAPDPTTGRGTGSFTIGSEPINFAYFVVNNSISYIMQEGEALGSSLFTGTMQTQLNPGQYSNTNFSGASVLAIYGVDQGGAVGMVGEVTANSSALTLAGEYDYNNSGTTAALLSGVQFTNGTFGTIASNGRGTMSIPITSTPPYTFDGVFYLTGTNTGYVLDATAINGNFTLFGTLQPQASGVQGGPANGNYFGGTIPPVAIGDEFNPVPITVATLTMSSLAFTGEQDVNDARNGPIHAPILGGTYTAADSFGRGTLTVTQSPGFGDGAATIYLVSPNQFVMLTMESGSINADIGVFTTP